MAQEAIRKNVIRQTTDRPLHRGEVLGIAAMCLFLTPLAGFAYWWGFRAERPRAAKQVLWVTWPLTGAFTLLWSSIIVFRLLGCPRLQWRAPPVHNLQNPVLETDNPRDTTHAHRCFVC